MAEKRQCAEYVTPEGQWGSFHQHPCQSPATVEADGKWWCVRHSPEGKAKAAREQRARWDAKRKASRGRLAGEREMRRRANVHEQMLEALKACYEVLAGGSYHSAPCVDQARDAIKAAKRGASKAAKKEEK